MIELLLLSMLISETPKDLIICHNKIAGKSCLKGEHCHRYVRLWKEVKGEAGFYWSQDEVFYPKETKAKKKEPKNNEAKR